MALYRYVDRIQRLDNLIRNKSTGPPKELASKLGISERWLFILLEELKLDLDCPIGYDRKQRSYYYKEDGKVVIGFVKDLSKEENQQITGGALKFNFSHPLYLYVQLCIIY